MTHQIELIQKLAECAASCEICLDACMDEEDIKKMVPCIRLDRDCAKMCTLAGAYVASHSSFTSQIIKQCEEICEMCAEECAKHDNEHCQQCAEACRECASACRSYSSSTAIL